MNQTCYHENFQAQVTVARIENEKEPFSLPRYYYAEVRINCAECQVEFHFVGIPGGLSPFMPSVSVDGCELRAPIVPGAVNISKSVFVLPSDAKE
jgi:hypothetical protein